MKPSIPDWLKTDPLVCHVPDRILFTPQRRIIYRNAIPHLLDANDDAYRLSDCDRVRLEHLRGIALIVTEGAPLTVYHDPRRVGRLGSDGLIVTDGVKQLGIRILPEATEVEAAAQSFATAFDGVIGKLEDWPCP